MADGTLVHDDNGDVVLLGPRDVAPAPPRIEGHGENLAETLDEATLSLIGSTLTTDIAHDQNSREAWDRMAGRWMDALGIGPESKPDDYEYEFADTSNHPLLLSALLNFQAKALSALMPLPDTVVHTEVDMDLDSVEDHVMRAEIERQLSAASRRVRDFYNWYLTKAVPSYVAETDLILHDCGLSGVGIRRIGVDLSRTKTPVRPRRVDLENLILSYDTTDFRSTGRLTHKDTIKTADLVRAIQTGVYRAVEVAPGMIYERSEIAATRDRLFGVEKPISLAMEEHAIFDVFTYLYLPNDLHPMMFARPYMVTIHRATQEVLAIRRNWKEGDPDEEPIEHFAAYIYSPGRNALSAVGLGSILTNITLALRKAQRRALDAGYLANHPAGFIAGGVSIRDDATRIVPGELRPVDSASPNLQQSILMNPFKGPDQGLIALYDRMNDAGRELGNIAAIDFAAMVKSGIAAGPALAAYDESTEFQTSVHRRLYQGHYNELAIIHERMRETLGGQRIQFGTDRFLEENDLFVVSLLPAMKPGFVSRQRAIMEAQLVYDLAAQNPQEMRKRSAIEMLLSAIGVKKPELLLQPDPEQMQAQPADAVSEYMKLMKGEPLKAGPAQNHQAHIAAHKAQLDGLHSTQIPAEMGDLMSAALGAHIAEHEGLFLATQVAAALGLPFEAFEQGIPPEIEAQIAPQMAQIVAQIEAQRASDEAMDPRIAVEQMRSETRVAVEQMKAEQEELKRQAQLEIARITNEARVYMNITDNLYAVEIAKFRESGAEPAKPDNPVPPDLAPRTPMPRHRLQSRP